MKLLNQTQTQPEVILPLTYDKKYVMQRPATMDVLNRSDYEDFENEYRKTWKEDSSYRGNKYHNKYHRYMGDSLTETPATKSLLASSRSYTPLPSGSGNVSHNRPWSYGKVETSYYQFRDSRVKK